VQCDSDCILFPEVFPLLQSDQTMGTDRSDPKAAFAGSSAAVRLEVAAALGRESALVIRAALVGVAVAVPAVVVESLRCFSKWPKVVDPSGDSHHPVDEKRCQVSSFEVECIERALSRDLEC
jgi:hypothetical protein